MGDTNPEIHPFREEGMSSFKRAASRYPAGYPVLSERVLTLGNSVILPSRVGRV